MQAATPPSPAGSATPRSVLALVCALAVYAGSVALLDGVGSALGRDMSMLDKHLAVIAFAGLAALSHGEALWVALCVLGFGVYRWYRNGRRMDATIALSFTSIALVVASMLHAVDAAERRTGLHAQALAAAVNQGDRSGCARWPWVAKSSAASRGTAARWCGWSATRHRTRTSMPSAPC